MLDLCIYFRDFLNNLHFFLSSLLKNHDLLWSWSCVCTVHISVGAVVVVVVAAARYTIFFIVCDNSVDVVPLVSKRNSTGGEKNVERTTSQVIRFHIQYTFIYFFENTMRQHNYV